MSSAESISALKHSQIQLEAIVKIAAKSKDQYETVMGKLIEGISGNVRAPEQSGQTLNVEA